MTGRSLGPGFVVGIYLTAKGFKRSSPLLDVTRRVPAHVLAPAAA